MQAPASSCPPFDFNTAARFTDFDDSPVGSRERAANAAPRAMQQAPSSAHRVGRGAVNLGSRIANAVAPTGKRTDEKMRASLQETSAAIGELIGALSHSAQQPRDIGRAKRILDGLGARMRGMTKRGADPDDVFYCRLGHHLEKMTDAEVRALCAGLDCDLSEDLGVHAGYFFILRESANEVNTERFRRRASTDLALAKSRNYRLEGDRCGALVKAARAIDTSADSGCSSDQLDAYLERMPVAVLMELSKQADANSSALRIAAVECVMRRPDLSFVPSPCEEMWSAIEAGEWTLAIGQLRRVQPSVLEAEHLLTKCLSHDVSSEASDYLALVRRHDFVVALIETGVFAADTRKAWERLVDSFSNSVTGIAFLQRHGDAWYESRGLPNWESRFVIEGPNLSPDALD
ncbi:MAG: hypothetical protein V4669_18485 [Pseudomonadota bacterium]